MLGLLVVGALLREGALLRDGLLREGALLVGPLVGLPVVGALLVVAHFLIIRPRRRVSSPRTRTRFSLGVSSPSEGATMARTERMRKRIETFMLAVSSVECALTVEASNL
jgi:hypothetical protein